MGQEEQFDAEPLHELQLPVHEVQANVIGSAKVPVGHVDTHCPLSRKSPLWQPSQVVLAMQLEQMGMQVSHTLEELKKPAGQLL